MDSAIARMEYEELGTELKDLLAPRYERLGYLGEFFKCAAHQPDALAAFIRFTESAKGGLPKNLVEVIALTCAAARDNRYELHQHERLSVRLGFGRDWVRAIEQLDPDASQAQISDDEALVQRYVLAALAEANPAGWTDLLVARFGQGDAVATVMVTARYIAHSAMIASFAIGPVVPSIWEDGFDGS